MKRQCLQIICASALVIATMAVSANAQEAASQSEVVDGIEIDWGVFPAQNISRSHDASEKAMHGGAAAGVDKYHLTIALTDTRTGKQIGDATVQASVYSIGLSGPWKTLQTMHVDATVSYGNYLEMDARSPVPYRIKLRIISPELTRPIVTAFTRYHD